MKKRERFLRPLLQIWILSYRGPPKKWFLILHQVAFAYLQHAIYFTSCQIKAVPPAESFKPYFNTRTLMSYLRSNALHQADRGVDYPHKRSAIGEYQDTPG